MLKITRKILKKDHGEEEELWPEADHGGNWAEYKEESEVMFWGGEVREEEVAGGSGKEDWRWWEAMVLEVRNILWS